METPNQDSGNLQEPASLPDLSVTPDAVVEEVVKDTVVSPTPDNAIVRDTDMYAKLTAIASGDSFLSMPDESAELNVPSTVPPPKTSDPIASYEDLLIQSDDQFQQVIGSREKFNELLMAIAKRSHESAILAGARTAKTVANATVKGSKLAETFYQINPDLIPHKSEVKQIAAVLSALDPSYKDNVPALLVATANGVRQYISAAKDPVVGALDKKDAGKTTDSNTPIRKGAARPVTAVEKPESGNEALMNTLFGPVKSKQR